MQFPKTHSAALWLTGILLIAFVVYLPGLYGDFMLDDLGNIVDNEKVYLNALTWSELSKVAGSGVASILTRPISMLTFGFNIYFTGIDPFAFKLTNLVIHLATAICLYFLVLELVRAAPPASGKSTTDDKYLALFVTACWTLHPANVSTVLYIVQRMTELAALITVFTLYLYCRFRITPCKSTSIASLRLAILGLLTIAGILCKENAALTPLLAFILEIFLFRFKYETAADRFFLLTFLSVFLAIPAILALVGLVVAPLKLLGDYSERDFNMWERLMTESRVIWHYISWVIAPDRREFIFFHDNFTVSRSLLSPVTTLAAIIGLIILISATWLFRHRYVLPAMGTAFFLVGHLLESTIFSLELVFEHRNYLPGIGIILAVCYGLFNLPRQILSTKVKHTVCVIILFFLANSTSLEANKWSNTFEHTQNMASLAPDSHRANYALALIYMKTADLVPDTRESLIRARHYFLESSKASATALRGHLGYMLVQSQLAEPMDEVILEEVKTRLSNNKNLMRDGFSELSRLTDCWYAATCKFPQSTLVSLYNALAKNTNADRFIVQGILDQVGTALVTIYNRPTDGKALLYLARSKSMEITLIDLKLIQMELTDGNLDQAELLISLARSEDPVRFEVQLNQLAERLSELKNSAEPF